MGLMIHAEYQEAVGFHQWLELRGIPHTHVVNEQPNKMRAIAEKRMGKSPGFPDYLVFLPNRVNVAIELKPAHGNGKASKLQRKWLKQLVRQGFKVAICHGALEAIQFVKECGYEEPSNASLKMF